MMKVCIYILFCFLTFIYLNGQDEKESNNTQAQSSIKPKIVKTRSPDIMKHHLISHKVSGIFGVGDFTGFSNSVEYERKIEDKPIAWYVSLAAGSLDANSDSDDEKVISANFFHAGGGLHYYPYDFISFFKPYLGLGGIMGGNRHFREISDEEFSHRNENEEGFDIGVHGILGVRWGIGLIRCGLEYRLGYFRTKVFEDQISTDRHELSFSFSFQF